MADVQADYVIAEMTLPWGEWLIEEDRTRQQITIRVKPGTRPDRSGGRRILLVDGGEA